jgi:hypothetical protein
VGAIGDVVQTLIGAVPGLSSELNGSAYAPTPTVSSRPGAVPGAHAWSAPSASGRGQVSVHRDVLRGVAVGMRSDLADLDGAVSGLNGVRRGEGVSITTNTGLIAGWSTAVAFNGNASAAFAGVMKASQLTGTAHQAASTGLTTSAAAYDQSESDNQRAVRSVGTNLYSVAGLVASYGSGQPLSLVLGAQPSYPVKTQAVSAFSGSGMSVDTIMDILHGLNGTEVADAGRAHAQLGQVLDSVATRLAGNAGTLSKSWTGNAAEAAMGQFQQLHTRLSTLAQQAAQVGSVLSWLGSDVLPKFANLPDPRVSLTSLVVNGAVTGTVTAGLPGAVLGAGAGLLDDLDGEAQAAANTAAQQYIAQLSNYLVIADQSLPDSIGAPAAQTPARGSSGAADPVVPGPGGAPGSGPGTGTGLATTGLTTIGRITAKGGSPTSKAPAAPVKVVGPIKTIGTGTPVSQPGGTTAPPSSLQGVTLPAGPAATPVSTASTVSSTSTASSSGGLTGALPGPVPTVSGAGVSGASEESAAENLDDEVVPNVGQLGGTSAGSAAETLDDEAMPNASPVDAAGSIAPEGSGLITGLDEPVGLADEAGFSAADSPVVGEVIGGQSAQLDADDSLPGPGGAIAAPDDMEGFPMMGSGSAGRPDEQERIRESWLRDDDLWRLSANVVPTVISGGK